MVASRRGHLETVSELLTAGAKADAQDQVSIHTEYYQWQWLVYVVVVQEGLTSLAFAAQNGHTQVVKALLEGNADPNIIENVSI